MELMRLEHATLFREASLAIIEEVRQLTYQPMENSLPQTATGSMPSVVLPEPKPHFPVLYQVVNARPGQGLTLEAKDFFIMGPDLGELHLIKMDQFATNIASNTRGFDRALVSNKDFVWVYSVEPPRAAVRNPNKILDLARTPRATILDNKTTFIFRVKDFVFVTPPALTRRSYGITVSLLNRYNSIKGLRVALESGPKVVPVSPSLCDFPITEAREDEFLTAITRPNVSTTIRFSEKPVSKEAQEQLCGLVRRYPPAHHQEGLLPLKVSKLTDAERAWLDDRAGPFVNYRRNPSISHRRIAQIFNVACSALVAVNCMNDDQRTQSTAVRL